MGLWEWLRGEKEKGGGDKERDQNAQSLIFPPIPQLQIKLEYKRIKHIILKIKSSNTLHISSPLGVNIQEIEEVLYKREEWIRSKLGSFPKQSQESYKSDGVIYHLGERVQIKFSQSLRAKAVLQGNVLSVEARSEEQIREVVEKWQKSQAQRVFAEVLSEWERVFGVNISHLSIKKMTSRWGSLNPKKGYINLNLTLVKMPRKLIEYVALHEIIHFFHYHHDKNFYAMMGEKMPDWREREGELRGWKWISSKGE